MTASMEITTWADIGEPDERAYAIDGLLPIGCVTCLDGPDGIGKSTLALQMAAGIASGGGPEHRWIAGADAPPVGAAIPSEGAPVVYASWDDGSDEQARRLSRIAGPAAPWVTREGLGNLRIADLTGPLWAVDLERFTAGGPTRAGVQFEAAAGRASVFVLDPLRAAYEGSDGSDEAGRAYVQHLGGWAKAHNVAVLVLSREPVGARSLLSLSRPSESATAALLQQVRANYGRPWPTLGLEPDTTDGYRWRVTGFAAGGGRQGRAAAPSTLALPGPGMRRTSGETWATVSGTTARFEPPVGVILGDYSFTFESETHGSRGGMVRQTKKVIVTVSAA